ncbi:TetR/AcrR family transcriptional regulator [Actinokineospora pegani]|uniref:TetR/AcrR family transcriptional regulator n=1 Tax=Actinokineospora pegani TaxID=2654637 RepID=UPI0018D41FAB|nr:TetR/AcrR family transcriptional regulator [Actinokineospora pegani]
MIRHRRQLSPERAGVRVPQAERAGAMRARLLDATIGCVAELGYGGASTNDIVRRARVSRGALAHHFPTKADLVSAAAQRLLESKVDEFRARFGAIAPDRRTPAEGLGVLWSFYADTGGLVLLELMVAARHNPELAEVLAPMPDRIAEVTAEVFTEFFPDLADRPFLSEALRGVHALFSGLALNALPDGDPAGRGAEVRAFVKLLVSAAPHLHDAAFLIPDPA